MPAIYGIASTALRYVFSSSASLPVIAAVASASVSYGAYQIHDRQDSTLHSASEFESVMFQTPSQATTVFVQDATALIRETAIPESEGGAPPSLGCTLVERAGACEFLGAQFKSADFAWTAFGAEPRRMGRSRYRHALNAASLGGLPRGRRLSAMFAAGALTARAVARGGGGAATLALTPPRSTAADEISGKILSTNAIAGRSFSNTGASVGFGSGRNTRARPSGSDCAAMWSCNVSSALRANQSSGRGDENGLDRPAAICSTQGYCESSFEELEAPGSIGTRAPSRTTYSAPVDAEGPGDLVRVIPSETPRSSRWVGDEAPFTRVAPRVTAPLPSEPQAPLAPIAPPSACEGAWSPCVEFAPEVPVTVNPEPSTLVLLSASLVMLFTVAKRKRR